MTVRIMVEVMMVEKAFAFHDQSNKQMFLLKFPLLFRSARIVAVI